MSSGCPKIADTKIPGLVELISTCRWLYFYTMRILLSKRILLANTGEMRWRIQSSGQFQSKSRARIHPRAATAFAKEIDYSTTVSVKSSSANNGNNENKNMKVIRRSSLGGSSTLKLRTVEVPPRLSEIVDL